MKGWLLVMLLAASQLAKSQTIVNDANAQKRDVTPFNGIHVSNAIDLYLSQGDEDALALSAVDAKHRDAIQTEVKDGILKIWYTNTGNHFGVGDKKLKAYVSFRNIKELKASGACDVFIAGVLKVPVMKLELSGASDMKGKVEIGQMSANVNGASELKISGSVDSLQLEVTGASDMKNYDLVVQNCDVKASGASDIKITVEKQATADASGASDIVIRGNAVLNTARNSGSSSVRKN